MPKVTHIAVTALKDNVKVVTARKQLRYRKIDGLPNGGMPDGQDAVYDQEHGITLQLDQTVELDVTDAQLVEFQKAVDAGDLDVVVHKEPVQPVAEQMVPMAKREEAPPAAPAAKGDDKGSKK